MNFITNYLSKRITRKCNEAETRGFKWAIYAYYKEGMALEEIESLTSYRIDNNRVAMSFDIGAREAIRVIPYQISKELQNIALMIDNQLELVTGERVGFSLITFGSPRGDYIGNCDRQESINQLEELLRCWKSEMPDIPAHEVN